MLLPSLRRSPAAPVLAARSLPAKSTRLSRLTFSPLVCKIERDRMRARARKEAEGSHDLWLICCIKKYASRPRAVLMMRLGNTKGYCESHIDTESDQSLIFVSWWKSAFCSTKWLILTLKLLTRWQPRLVFHCRSKFPIPIECPFSGTLTYKFDSYREQSFFQFCPLKWIEIGQDTVCVYFDDIKLTDSVCLINTFISTALALEDIQYLSY